MTADIPKTPLERGISGGKTAVRMSRKALAYLARRPFLTEEKRLAAKRNFNRDTAAVLFEGLSLLRGTALKAAQALSMELDFLPPEVAEELNKSCHRVPPINRALARKVVQNALGGPPEEFFLTFESQAFAAASLGQVHQATTREGESLAVKIQYPGIRETIQSDMRLIRTAFLAYPDRLSIEPAIAEIEARLIEETDYRRELSNMAYFRERLGLDGVTVPVAREDLSTDRVLTSDLLPGIPLDDWLRSEPSQEERDRVAQTLHDLFISGLYRLHCIHADPNPGNFLVGEDGHIGLVDFGCVKYFDEDFVSLYGDLVNVATNNDSRDYTSLLKSLQITGDDIDEDTQKRIHDVFYKTHQWLSRLYKDEFFDFNANKGFISSGHKLMSQTYAIRKHMRINTNFIFLHRTRYGLLRLFERIGARVCFRNNHEGRQPVS